MKRLVASLAIIFILIVALAGGCVRSAADEPGGPGASMGYPVASADDPQELERHAGRSAAFSAHLALVPEHNLDVFEAYSGGEPGSEFIYPAGFPLRGAELARRFPATAPAFPEAVSIGAACSLRGLGHESGLLGLCRRGVRERCHLLWFGARGQGDPHSPTGWRCAEN